MQSPLTRGNCSDAIGGPIGLLYAKSFNPLDLPDAELEALAFLEATFGDGPLPNAPQVHALLNRVQTLLPDDRRRHLGRMDSYPRLVRPAVTSSTAPEVLAQVKRAVGRQQLAFAYHSPYARPGTVEQHRVSPYDLVYREGHTYLEAHCHECSLPKLVGRVVVYRLDRIAADSLRLLPTRLPPGPLPRPVYHLCYWLSPHVAHQHDIRLWFPDSILSFQDDGAVLVSARITDLWQARQILLSYREHCRVLEPAPLIELMRESISRMTQLYLEDA